MEFKLFVTTDIHGSIFPTNYTSKDNAEDFGLAKIKRALEKHQAGSKYLLVDNGDAFQGSPLIDYTLDNYKRNLISDSFNHLQYDYYNLGNHDFNYGEAILLDYIENMNAKLLTSNILYKGQPLGSSQVVEIAGKKLALIGVCTHYIVNWEEPKHIENFEFLDAYTHLKSEVEQYQGKVDYVIGFYHGGLERDPQSGVATEELTGENQGYQMSKIAGLDLLITGHQHRSLVEKINGVYVTQSAQQGREFVEVVFSEGEIKPKLIEVVNYEADEEFLAEFEILNNETQSYLDEPIGVISNMDLVVKDGFLARLNKHPLVSFINQVQLERSGADISATALFNNVLGFESEITIRDIVSTYPFANTLVVKEVSGKVLKEMLEWSARYFSLDADNNIIVNPQFISPKPQHYNYDMFDGIDYTIKVSNPIGSRIVDLKYQGSDIKADDMFKLVINNYRAIGGGDYMMIAKAKTLRLIEESTVETIVNYLKTHSPIELKHLENIKVIV